MNARTLTVFRLYQLFNGIIFSGPIWAVFLLSRGLSLTQFGIVEAALHVGMLIAQVPTGALADALGRRRLLVAAGFFTASAELGYVYAPGFALICVAGGIHGIAFALRTGADEAYLFDSLAHDDAQAQFPRMLGGLWAVFQFAGAISFMAGGLIATYSQPLAFWLTAGCALAASAIATRLPDDRRGKVAHGVRVAARGLTALRRSPRLGTLTLAWSVYWAAVTSWWFYAAPLFQERGASDVVLGFVLGGAMLVGSGCSWIGGRIGERIPLTLSVGVGSLALAVGLVVGVTVPGLAVPVVLLMLISGVPELVYVTLSTYLQHNTRSEFRATSMSIAEGCFSIQMLWLFPLTGYVIQHEGYRLGYTLCGMLILVGAALFIASQWLPGLDSAGEDASATATVPA
ncbi:MAG TPA: MFS transporter [Gaiellales bacterium]|jgi:MFS family permease|nr:MFS transporter [Gaiellales bacterium]